MPGYKVSVVLFRSAGWWVAQCLEYDIATQAKTLEDLCYELQRVLVGRLTVSQELGLEPFRGLPAAPQKYWNMFNKARAAVSL